MKNLLTDRAFWQKYWESKTDIVVNIKSNYLKYHSLTDSQITAFEKVVAEKKSLKL